MTAVLRIAGPLLDPDLDAPWVPREKLEKVWRAGDTTLRGRVATNSGFTILLTDATEPKRMVREAMEAFVVLASHVEQLVKGGASAQIDFALFIGATGPRSLVLEPSMLRAIEQHGVRVIVSAYPVKEEEDDDD